MQGCLDFARRAIAGNPKTQQSIKAVAVAANGLGDLQPARGRFGQRVDRRDPTGMGAQQRRNQHAGQWLGVQRFTTSEICQLQLGRRGHQARCQASQRIHERNPWADLLGRLWRQRRQIHAARDCTCLDEVDDLAGQNRADRLLRFAG